MTDGYFPSAAGAVFYRIDGAPSAPWIVLSNSLAADCGMWQPQIPLLTRRYRVLRYDTRGHGASDAPRGPYSLTALVDDVVGLMDHLGIGQATYLGLSMGGMIGLGLALSRPERVSRLVCCAARADAPAAFIGSWGQRIAAVRQGGMAAIVDGTMARWLSPATLADRPDAAASVRAMILRTQVGGYVGCAEGLKGLAYRPLLGNIRTPALFVAGQRDEGAPAPVMAEMAAMVPGAVFAAVDNAAHLVNLDNPLGFERAISEFLDLPAA